MMVDLLVCQVQHVKAADRFLCGRQGLVYGVVVSLRQSYLKNRERRERKDDNDRGRGRQQRKRSAKM